MPKSKLSLPYQQFRLPVFALLTLALALIGIYKVTSSKAASADINGDGFVNSTDLSIVAAHYGLTGMTFAQGDLSGDGSIGAADLSILASNWGIVPRVVTVPASIDATGTDDVTSLLNNFLSAQSNNTVINFPANAKYRIEGTLVIQGKSNITINGNNATFFATTNGLAPPPAPNCQGTGPCNPNRGRMQWDFESDSDLTVRDTNVIGSAPNPGPNGDYEVAYEAQHGYNIGNGQNILLDHVTAKNVWGDLVYIGGGGANKASFNVTVQNSNLDGASRQCFSIVFADHVLVQNNNIGMSIGCRRSMFDMEANLASSKITNITIQNNDLGKSRFATLNNYGAGATEHDITFDGNRIHSAFGVDVNGTAPARRANYTITNNVSTSVPRNQPIIFLRFIDGIVVSGNTQAFTATGWPHRDYLGTQAPVWTNCSTNINVSGNNFTPRPPGMPEFVNHTFSCDGS